MSPHLPCVLVIDADSSIRDLVAAILRHRGLEADCAGDRDEAMASVRTRRYAAVVLDPRMPDGEALLAELQAAADGKPNIIIATAPDHHSPTLAGRTGVEAVLSKPFDVEELSAAVRRVACCD